MPAGTGIQERVYASHGSTINYTLDGRDATISASHDKDYSKPKIYPNPVDLIQEHHNVLPSGDIVRFQKAKHVIDGIYAQAEVAVHTGDLSSLSKDDFLQKLYGKVLSYRESHGTDIADRAAIYLATALGLRGIKVPVPSELLYKVDHAVSAFGMDELASKPLGFYAWSGTPSGTQIYQSLKYLQNSSLDNALRMGVPTNEQALVYQQLRALVRDDPTLEAMYGSLLRFDSAMTNPPMQDPSLFPPSIIPDQELFMELQRQGGASKDLGTILAGALKSGAISFKPNETSGLYTRQMWEVECWINRDQAPEWAKYIPDKEYEKLLEERFISQWVGTRETHIGRTRHMLIGAALHREVIIKVPVVPELDVEPMATTYARMVESLDFMEASLSQILGDKFLERAYRLREDGSRSDVPIAHDVHDLKRLLRGLEALSKEGIHVPFQNGSRSDMQYAKHWLENLADDPDVNRDSRIIVPIIGHPSGMAWINYAITGYQPFTLDVKYQRSPEVSKVSPSGVSVEFHFPKEGIVLPTLKHVELIIPVSKGQLNSREFRKIADRYSNVNALKSALEI